MSSSQVKEAGELAGRVLTEVEKAVVGKSNALRLVLAGILAKGHVLLEDYPGLGRRWRRGPSPRPSASTSRVPSSPPTCCRPT